MSLTNTILESLNREVLNQLELAKSIKHAGENGRAREKIISAYLRRLTPEEFGIDTGFVFDSAGNMSKQIDIVIYRKNYHPVFEIGGIKHFIVESVVAVIENKASILSTENLNQALENIKSVKALDRTCGGSNYTISGTNRGMTVQKDLFEHQVFGAIVTEDSLKIETFKKCSFEFFKKNPDRNLWPNIYADVRSFSSLYAFDVKGVKTVTVIAREASEFYVSDKNALNNIPPLLVLSFELINYLRVSAVIDFSPVSYLGGNQGKGYEWALP